MGGGVDVYIQTQMTAENSTSVKECSSLLEYIGTHWHRELRSESAVNIGMKMWEM